MCSTVINKQKVYLMIDAQKDSFINKSEFEFWRNRILEKVEKRDSLVKDFALRDRLVYDLGNELGMSDHNILVDMSTHQTLVLKLRPTGEKPFNHQELVPIYRDIIKFRTRHDDLTGYNIPRCDIYEYKSMDDFKFENVFTYCVKNGYDSIFVDKYLISGFYGGLSNILGTLINGIKLYYYDHGQLVELSINREVM